MAIVALVPSHNEEERLPAALASLLAQTRPLDRIIVVSDNSTDRTQDIARSHGGPVELYETVGNRDKKAGALNQALDAILPTLDHDDLVFVMDADSRIVPDFMRLACEKLASDDTIGAVGGVFLTQDDETLLMRLQSNEYLRYSREIARDKARARVLTGTATLISAMLLCRISDARSSDTLPGSGFYNLGALCEDFDLTVAIKSLGLRCLSPQGCIVYTEAMDTLPKLWRQRTRWQRGALQCIASYGINRATLPYVAKQAQMLTGILVMSIMTALTVYAVVMRQIEFQAIWFDLGMVFLIERMVSVWRGGPRGIRLAAMVVPEMVFDIFISAVYLWCCALTLTGRGLDWGISTIDNTRKE